MGIPQSGALRARKEWNELVPGINYIKVFRDVLVFSSICSFVILIRPYMFWDIGRDHEDVFFWYGFRGLSLVPSIIWLDVSLLATAAVGMLFWKKWSRLLYGVIVVFHSLYAGFNEAPFFLVSYFETTTVIVASVQIIVLIFAYSFLTREYFDRKQARIA